MHDVAISFDVAYLLLPLGSPHHYLQPPNSLSFSGLCSLSVSVMAAVSLVPASSLVSLLSLAFLVSVTTAVSLVSTSFSASLVSVSTAVSQVPMPAAEPMVPLFLFPHAQQSWFLRVSIAICCPQDMLPHDGRPSRPST